VRHEVIWSAANALSLLYGRFPAAATFLIRFPVSHSLARLHQLRCEEKREPL
jgi:hypothetical protein